MSCIEGIEQIIFSDNKNEILPHAHHNVHQIFFIMRGSVHVQINEKSYFVNRPTAVFVSNFETHSFTAEQGEFTRFCISLSPTLIKQELKSDKLSSIISDRPTHFCHCVDIEAISVLIEEMLWELVKEKQNKDRDFPENASSLLRCIFVALYRHAPDSFPFDDNNISSIVQKVKHKIETDFTSEQSLNEFADEFHLSRYYLAHAFKELTGYRIKNYRMLGRIAEARELLVNTSMSVSDISDRIGFPDTSNFSKYFKKKEGYTPSQYRNLHKGEK